MILRMGSLWSKDQNLIRLAANRSCYAIHYSSGWCVVVVSNAREKKGYPTKAYELVDVLADENFHKKFMGEGTKFDMKLSERTEAAGTVREFMELLNRVNKLI